MCISQSKAEIKVLQRTVIDCHCLWVGTNDSILLIICYIYSICFQKGKFFVFVESQSKSGKWLALGPDRFTYHGVANT